LLFFHTDADLPDGHCRQKPVLALGERRRSPVEIAFSAENLRDSNTTTLGRFQTWSSALPEARKIA